MMDAGKAMERSVDSLQKLYAVVVALAIGHGIIALAIGDRASMAFRSSSDLLIRLPAFLAFMVTLVPFFHGMNRHLDRCYLQDRVRATEAPRGALLFDFFVFFAQSSLLFLIALSVSEPQRAMMFLGALVASDVLWGLVSHWIHYHGENAEPGVNGPAAWAMVNVLSLALGLGVALTQIYSPETKLWVLFILACARTVADYKVCWGLYFPSLDSEKGKRRSAAVAP
jgi:hypothetical protein